MSKHSAGGTPDFSNRKNLEWWTFLFQGFVNGTIQGANESGKMRFHMWNETKENFWQVGTDGDYHEYFYQSIGSYDSQIGDAITYNPATITTTWEDWYLPYLK